MKKEYLFLIYVICTTLKMIFNITKNHFIGNRFYKHSMKCFTIPMKNLLTLSVGDIKRTLFMTLIGHY